MNDIKLTKTIQTYWLHLLDEHRRERDTSYSDYFELFTEWLFQYFNELPLFKFIEIAHLIWKSEQHRLTPKYDILSSLGPLLKHCFVNI